MLQCQSEAGEAERNEGGKDRHWMVGRIQHGDQEIAESGADRGHDIDPGARQVLITIRHDVGDQPGVCARHPVPPKRQIEECERIKDQAAAAAERR
ncbi:MAG: hypothetical protein FD148_862 [Methylocystaceae bacterium]|nr:MAG: hypothetical protein FD148_862 [Methylocystaceae bacterium]